MSPDRMLLAELIHGHGGQEHQRQRHGRLRLSSRLLTMSIEADPAPDEARPTSGQFGRQPRPDPGQMVIDDQPRWQQPGGRADDGINDPVAFQLVPVRPTWLFPYRSSRDEVVRADLLTDWEEVSVRDALVGDLVRVEARELTGFGRPSPSGEYEGQIGHIEWRYLEDHSMFRMVDGVRLMLPGRPRDNRMWLRRPSREPGENGLTTAQWWARITAEIVLCDQRYEHASRRMSNGPARDAEMVSAIIDKSFLKRQRRTRDQARLVAELNAQLERWVLNRETCRHQNGWQEWLSQEVCAGCGRNRRVVEMASIPVGPLVSARRRS